MTAPLPSAGWDYQIDLFKVMQITQIQFSRGTG